MIGYKGGRGGGGGGGGGVYAESGEPALASHAELETVPEVEVVLAAGTTLPAFAGHCC